MTIYQRCRILTLGLVGWIAVVALRVEEAPLSELMGLFHATVAGAIVALAILPRETVRWLR